MKAVKLLVVMSITISSVVGVAGGPPFTRQEFVEFEASLRQGNDDCNEYCRLLCDSFKSCFCVPDKDDQPEPPYMLPIRTWPTRQDCDECCNDCLRYTGAAVAGITFLASFHAFALGGTNNQNPRDFYKME